MKKFAAHPMPVEGESLTGYLMRLGKANCIFQPAEIMEALGVCKTSNVTKGWSQPASIPLFQALERVLERPIKPFLNGLEALDDLDWLREPSRLVQDVRMGYPRICTHCIAENGILDWRWSLAFTSTCPEHSSLLVAECPNCKKALKWSGSLLIGCDKCEMNWSELESPGINPVSELESRVWSSLAQDPASIDTALLQDVCRALVFMVRPFDTLHDTVKVTPRMIEHSHYVARAYQILEDPLAFAQWRKQCRDQRSEMRPLGDQFLEAPCKLFFDGLLNKWEGPRQGLELPLEGGSLTYEFLENTRYISQTRHEHGFESNAGIGYRYQLDIASIAFVQGWDQETAGDLVGGGVFSTFKGVKQSKKRRFDAHEIISKLLHFSGPTDKNWVEISINSPVFNRNFANPGKLINDILRQAIPGAFKQSDLLSSVYVDPERFSRWLENECRTATRRSVRLSQVMAALECSKQDVRRLVQEQKLRWATRQVWEQWVDGPSLFEYMIGTER